MVYNYCVYLKGMKIVANKHFMNESVSEYENRMVFFRMILVGGLVLLIITMFAATFDNCTACKEEEAVTAVAEKLTGVETYPCIIEGPLDADWSPSDLMRLIGAPNGDNVLLRREAAEAYLEMHNAMVAEGMSVIPVEGYRSAASQTDMYNAEIYKLMGQGSSHDDAATQLRKELKNGGLSEHQLGLTVDVTTQSGVLQEDFASLVQGRWLVRNAHKYGFIFRYPDTKESVTGMNARPWELRYVGRDTAEFMAKYSLCLEEYIEICKKDCPESVMEGIE